MKIKSVNELHGGEHLAEPLLTKEREMLLPKGAMIKEEYISLLESAEIKSVSIEDPYRKYEHAHPIAEENHIQRLTELVQSLMEKHIYHDHKSLLGFEMIANEMVKGLEEVDGQVYDLEERKSNLYEHTVYVTLLSMKAAMRLQLENVSLYEIALGCLLHDLGLRYTTVEYTDCEWNKKSPEEIFEIKKHTILGYSALDEEGWIPEVSKKMVLAHHERRDGSGYPMKRKYRDQGCQLIQICDSFDCMISGMECKRTPVWSALDELQQQSDIKYEKEYVETLVSMVARYPVGTKVKLNQGDIGIIIQQTTDSQKPIIMLEKDVKKKHNLKLEKDISILEII